MDNIKKDFIKKKISLDNSKPLIFQSLFWEEKDIVIDDSYKCVIFITGVDKEGNSVTVTVNDFTPYFYIEIKDTLSSSYLKKVIDEINERLGRNKNHLVSVKKSKRQKVLGYQCSKKHTFLKLTFDSLYTF